VKTQFISSMENKEPFKVRFALFHTMKMKSNQTMAAKEEIQSKIFCEKLKFKILPSQLSYDFRRL